MITARGHMLPSGGFDRLNDRSGVHVIYLDTPGRCVKSMYIDTRGWSGNCEWQLLPPTLPKVRAGWLPPNAQASR